jgi:hypothetical protein
MRRHCVYFLVDACVLICFDGIEMEGRAYLYMSKRIGCWMYTSPLELELSETCFTSHHLYVNFTGVCLQYELQRGGPSLIFHLRVVSAVPLPPNRQARINAGEARHATCMVEDPHYLYDRHGWIERPN